MNALLRLAAVLTLLPSLPAVHAAPLKEAEFTQVVNQVNILPPDESAIPASVGRRVYSPSAVQTGVGSRAELRFPDETITRVGALSTFRLEEKRTIGLEQGVILLQVPKRKGGAKVRTASVTAAITGTTVIFEYLANGFMKLIVVEGVVDLFFNDRPNVFRTVKAGQMLIVEPNAQQFPLPVDVDLNRLQDTSTLLNDDQNEGALGNRKQMTRAFRQQERMKGKGDLQTTPLVLPGRGTEVVLSSERNLNVTRTIGLRSSTNGDPRGPLGPNDDRPRRGGDGTPLPGDGDGTGPIAANFGPPILIPGLTEIDASSVIVTNPTITAFNEGAGDFVTSRGRIYRPLIDGPFDAYAFGSATSPLPELDPYMASRGRWAHFQFGDLDLLGNPTIDSTPGPRNLTLAAENTIIAADPGFEGETEGPPSSGLFSLTPSLDTLLLTTRTGGIIVGSGFYFEGIGSDLIFYAPASKIELFGTVDLSDGDFYAFAGTETDFDGAYIVANDVRVGLAGGSNGPVIVQDTDIMATGQIDLASSGSVEVTNSTLRSDPAGGASVSVENTNELLALAHASEEALERIFLEGGSGGVSVNNSTLEAPDVEIFSDTGVSLDNVTINSDRLIVEALGSDGVLKIGNNSSLSAAQIMKLYARGSSGKVLFDGPASLKSNEIHIAGRIVEILSGVNVDVDSPNLNVYTGPGGDRFGTTGFGDFSSGGSPISVVPQPLGTEP